MSLSDAKFSKSHLAANKLSLANILDAVTFEETYIRGKDNEIRMPMI